MKELNFINFKEFLEGEGVDAKLFWKNCKKKYNNNVPESTRKQLKTRLACDWLCHAFDWEDSLQALHFDEWFRIDNKWLQLTKNTGKTIVFGF